MTRRRWSASASLRPAPGSSIMMSRGMPTMPRARSRPCGGRWRKARRRIDVAGPQADIAPAPPRSFRRAALRPPVRHVVEHRRDVVPNREVSTTCSVWKVRRMPKAERRYGGEARNPVPSTLTVPRVGRTNPLSDIEQRGLAGAVRADQSGNGASSVAVRSLTALRRRTGQSDFRSRSRQRFLTQSCPALVVISAARSTSWPETPCGAVIRACSKPTPKIMVAMLPSMPKSLSSAGTPRNSRPATIGPDQWLAPAMTVSANSKTESLAGNAPLSSCPTSRPARRAGDAGEEPGKREGPHLVGDDIDARGQRADLAATDHRPGASRAASACATAPREADAEE